MSGKCPKATEKKPPSQAQKPSVKAKAVKEAASDSETTKTKKTPKTKGQGKKVAELAEECVVHTGVATSRSSEEVFWHEHHVEALAWQFRGERFIFSNQAERSRY